MTSCVGIGTEPPTEDVTRHTRGAGATMEDGQTVILLVGHHFRGAPEGGTVQYDITCLWFQ